MTAVLTVVVPLFNEEAVAPLFFKELRPVLDGLMVDYEVVCVDDGSRDGTAKVLLAAAEDWSQLRVVRLLRNSGHQAALSAGYERANGEYVVTIDADLQDPPSVVAEMFDIAVREHVDVVYGVRNDRSNDGWVKRHTARVYYRLMRRLAGEQVPLDAGDFRLVSRRVLDAVRDVPEHGRVYRLIIPWYGFPSREVTYRREERAAGKSKYPFLKMLGLAVDSIATFSAAPLRLATWAGALGAAICLGAIMWSLTAWVLHDTVPGWSSLVGALGLIGAIQLLCIGMLGEYVSRIFARGHGRPSYVVGFDSALQPRTRAVSEAEEMAGSALVSALRAGTSPPWPATDPTRSRSR